MARTFLAGFSQYLENASAVLTAAPLSMACWFYASNVTDAHALMSLGVGGTTADRFALLAAGSVAGDPISAQTVETISGTPTGNPAKTSTSFSALTWAHACGVWATSQDRRAYLNGGGKGTETATNVSPQGLALTSIGAYYTAGGRGYMTGRICECAIWNIALDDSEVAELALGIQAFHVRPENLVLYVPLYGRFSPEPDIVGGYNMTVTGATVIEPPRLRYTKRRAAFTFGRGVVRAAADTPSATFAVQAPATTGKGIIAAGVLSPTLGVQAPDATGKALILPAAQTATFSVQSPSTASGGQATPSEVAATFSVPDPAVIGKAAVSAGVLSPAFAVVDPAVVGKALVSPSAVSATFSVVDPVPVGGTASGGRRVLGSVFGGGGMLRRGGGGLCGGMLASKSS